MLSERTARKFPPPKSGSDCRAAGLPDVRVVEGLHLEEAQKVAAHRCVCQAFQDLFQVAATQPPEADNVESRKVM